MEFVRLAETVVNAIDRLQALESRQLYMDGHVEFFVPASLRLAVRSELEPREADLWVALDILDPENALLRSLMTPMDRPGGLGGKIRRTFEQGIEQVVALIEDDPEQDFSATFFPDEALEVIDSKLIQFDPDAWLDRLALLAPVRTRTNLQFPSHLRLRLVELYRTYMFGCWLATISLSRSILEYSLHDNASRLSISKTWPPDRDGHHRPKRLSHLIEDFGASIPGLLPSMERLRDLGNEYMHPTTSKRSKETLMKRQAHAEEAVKTILPFLEELYALGRDV